MHIDDVKKKINKELSKNPIKKSDTWVIETRDEATINNRIKYWTGEPCVRGHISRRYTSSGVCCECSREYSQLYQQRRTNELRGIKQVPETWVIETRGEALTAGRNKYWTGRSCARGHKSRRYASSGICCQCNYENSQAYQKRRTNELRGIDDPMVRVSVKVHRDQAQALRDYAGILNKVV